MPDLYKRMLFIYREVLARGGRTACSFEPTKKIMQIALKFIADFTEEKNGIIRPKSAKTSHATMMLSYYRNSIVHFFLNEAEIATALVSLVSAKKSARAEEVYELTLVIKDLLCSEFVLKDKMRTFEDFKQIVELMKSRGIILEKPDGQLSVDLFIEKSTMGVSFLCQQVYPYIDTYAVILAFMSTQGATVHDEETLYPKLQWVVDTLYQSGQLGFLESCMLEAVKNAVKRFSMMGVLKID